MSYEGRKGDQPQRGQASQPAQAASQLVLAPGKRTRTESLPPGPAGTGASVQRKPDPIADPARQERRALTALWIDTAIRPDLYSPPVQRKATSAGTANTVVQKQGGSPGNVAAGMAPTSLQVDKPVAGDNRPGFIDNGDGSNIRTRPAELAGSQTLTAAPLPPATRVFVSGRHPQTAEWWYVTAFLPDAIIRGYVQGFRVATDLPEPTAKLYQIKSGDTAEKLAVQEFASAVRDGHDLRYYENVLLYVNRQHGRSGVKGSYQQPGLFGGGANNVQLEAGRRIWLVSPVYARALEGMVPDGSLTGGAVAKVERFAGHIQDLVKSVTESPGYLDEVAGEYAQAISDHMVEIVGIVAGFIAAEALSAFLAATPTGVGQIAAVVLQLGLAAFGAAGMVAAGVQALEHATQWLNLAWTAHGDEAQIAAASKEFVKMLVSIAMAALAYVGVKGNLGKAAAMADSVPTMMPAFAVAGSGQVGGAVEGVAVATGLPGPAGPLGTAMAMSMVNRGKGESSVNRVPEKGKSFRGGRKKDRDNWYGYNDKQFQRWWHREGKQGWGGSDIKDAAMAKEVYEYWVKAGRPTVK